MEVYLEDMALRGWMLKETNMFYAIIERIDPKKVHFTVDVFEIPKYKGERDPVEAKEYRDLCEAAGWHLIDGKGYLQFFYSEAEKRPNPIQTDLGTEARIVSASIWKTRVTGAIFALLFLTYTVFSYFPVSSVNLLDNWNIVATGLFPLLWIYFAVILVYLFRLPYQIKKKVERQEVFITGNYNKAKKRAWFLGGMIIFGAVFLLAVIMGDIIGGNQGTVIALIVTLLVVTATHVVNRGIQWKHRIKNDNLLYNVMGIGLLLLMLITPPTMFISENGRVQQPLPEEYPLLTGGSWGDFEGEEPEEFHYYTQKSHLVPEYYEVRYPLDQPEVIYQLTYYRFVSPGVAKYAYGLMLEEGVQDFGKDHHLYSLWDVKGWGLVEVAITYTFFRMT